MPMSCGHKSVKVILARLPLATFNTTGQHDSAESSNPTGAPGLPPQRQVRLGTGGTGAKRWNKDTNLRKMAAIIIITIMTSIIIRRPP